MEVKVAIQGEEIKKIVAVLDLAKCSNSKTSPHQDSVSSTKEVAMEEDTVQQRHGDMENEELISSVRSKGSAGSPQWEIFSLKH